MPNQARLDLLNYILVDIVWESSLKNKQSGKFLTGVSVVVFTLAILWTAGRMIYAKTAPKRITIICTNDTLGTLQPCGCHGANSGGLPRRAKFIKHLISQNPNTIVVESGDLAFNVNPAEPTAQLEAVGKCLKLIGYAAVGVGPTDIQQFGEKYYDVMKRLDLPVVHSDSTDHSGTLPYIIREVGGVKVGIVSFGAVPPSKRDDFELTKARYRELGEARAKCDVLVLLDQGNVATDDWLNRNACHLGSPDIVVGGLNKVNLTDAKMVGTTMIVPTSTQGKYVNCINVDIDGDQKKVSFSRTQIDKSTDEDPEVPKVVRDYYDSQAVKPGANANATAEPYYGYKDCATCHPDEVEQWKSTRHAGALKTLLSQHKCIPDCLPCHSDMYRKQSGLAILGDQTGSVECAACHADVLPHGINNKKKGDTETIKTQCAKCHTSEKSPGFSIQDAYEKVRHGHR